ncbi:MAG: DUF4388 domain-containing protein [Acidobacteriota bacterium]
MSLSGKLEDVSLADVMQFIHLGRRTGTLSLTRGADRAEVGFYRGQIVSARSPTSHNLGETLVDRGLLERETLDQVLEMQEAETPRRSLGQLLVTSGILDFDTIRQSVEQQIEGAIYELVSHWMTGSFAFDLDELKPIDDIAMHPGDAVPKLNLNTQMLLLEASRLQDESRRDALENGGDPAAAIALAAQAAAGDSLAAGAANVVDEDVSDVETMSRSLEQLDVEIPMPDPESLPERTMRRLQVVSTDVTLSQRLTNIVDPQLARVVQVPLRSAGSRVQSEPAPIVVVLDLRSDTYRIDDLKAIRRSRPRASIIALVTDAEQTREAFQAGAVAALPADPHALAACFQSLVRTLQDASGGRSSANQGPSSANFKRLRRVLSDIRSGLMSATMALNLMHILSESVERAVLFLVQKNRLTALGAFGFGTEDRPLADATRGLTLHIEGSESVFARCIAEGQPRILSFEQAHLPEPLVALLGRPQNGQIVVFPVLGSERVISVVYTDNGANQAPIEDIELLELATAQVGVAFENELLRRQIELRR